MHIAVCDDNIADRKQLERLLKRESDKRKSDTGILYIDSFGDDKVLSKTPMLYDLFFIDMTEEAPDGYTFALSLIEGGVKAPIVLCSSKINYLPKMNLLSPCPTNLMHLEKPIKISELSETIDKALLMNARKVPTIELRSDTETCYVTEDDIVYAVSERLYIHVHLKDNRCISVMSTIQNFYHQIAGYSHMVLLNEHTIFNIVYMQKFTHFKVTLLNGTKLSTSPFFYKDIKNALQMYQKEMNQKGDTL